MPHDERPAPANVYADDRRAGAYATLGFPGTYALAFRDLPALIARHVTGARALDFGCGTGRSTRFLRALGFATVGVDISDAMLAHARAADPGGDYRRVDDGRLDAIAGERFDVALAAFTFDNIAGRDRKLALFRALAATLSPGGRIVTLLSSPDIYLHEWASFSTREFLADNRRARSGDIVRITMLDVDDRRPVEDVLCTDADYAAIHRDAGLAVLETLRPLGRPGEPQPWVSETTIAPWVLRVLAPAPGAAGAA